MTGLQDGVRGCISHLLCPIDLSDLEALGIRVWASQFTVASLRARNPLLDTLLVGIALLVPHDVLLDEGGNAPSKVVTPA